MIGIVWDLMVGSFWGRVVTAVLMGFVALGVNNALQRSKGAANERAKIERLGDANAEKAERARRAVSRTPDDRLRDRFFRD